ncbi:pyrroloquinoline quinone biosynthesis protein PqqE [Litorivicinus sp.]|nr:pyrroloquinoline quinone biosynthesis protein PqqE [Litorivicinus sp.]
MNQTILAPQVLLAEVTHRCPLQCPYCSNPTELIKKQTEISTEAWQRVFAEAASLGVLQVSISGGEPAARRDLTNLIKAARDADLYVNLITSGIGFTQQRLTEIIEAGCDHIQLSIQDVDPDGAELISNSSGSLEKKLKFARWVTDASVPLTLNAVMHRLNLDRLPETIDLAIALGARRLEIANVQYHGWAELNKSVLMPTREQSDATNQIVDQARQEHQGRLLIDYVPVDHYAEYPKACMNGWGRVALIVAPDGSVLPCHNATNLKHLNFTNVNDASLENIWYESEAFNAYRGDSWMPDVCKSCDRKDIDFGGCRCQALAILGDPAAADPVCSRAHPQNLIQPEHAESTLIHTKEIKYRSNA